LIIVANTWSMASSGRASWNKSLMLLTKTRCGFRQRLGSSSFDGISSTLPVQNAALGPPWARRFANVKKGAPGPENRAAMRSA